MSDIGSDDGSYEVVDLTDNPLFLILANFLEDNEGHNICEHLAKLTASVEKNSKLLQKLLIAQQKS